MSIIQLSAEGVAGNVTTDFLTPSGTQRNVLYGGLSLTTDATVANRLARLTVLDSGSNIILCMCAGAFVTASATDQLHSYMQGVFRETSFINDMLHVPIAQKLVVPPGYTIRAFVTDGQAGDSYDVRLMVQESNEGGRV